MLTSVAWFVLQAVDNAHIMSMLSFSRRYADSAAANPDLYSLVGAQLRATRVYVHYAVLLTIDIWFACFYGALFAYKLVPRWLGALGLGAVILHVIGIPLSTFIGYPIIWALAYPLGLSYLAFGGWLVAKGFRDA